ncbi:MAG: HAD family hydrolase [Desulfurococcaceae archaeon]
MIRVLSIDLWDTIVRSERGPFESYTLMKLEALQRALGGSGEATFSDILEVYKRVLEYKGVIPPRVFAKMIALLVGYRPDDPVVEKAVQEYEEASYVYTPVLVPGARELLTFARRAGLKIVVVTNTSFSAKAVERTLCNAGLCNMFDYIASSADLGLMKPNPAIFHVALRAVQAEPSEAVHIGDSCIRDALGAVLAGMKPMLLARSKGSLEACRNVTGLTVVKDMYEALELLKRMVESEGRPSRE